MKHNKSIFFRTKGFATLQKGLLWFVLFFGNMALVFAGFNLAVSTITQSGTDTSLAGLSGISGVTVTTLGGVTYYNIGARALNFSGTQTIDGRTERIISSFSPGNYVYQVAGTLTINDFEDKSGDRVYFANEVLTSTYSNSACCGNYGLVVSGTLKMNGGRIRSNSSISFTASSRLEIINGGFVTDLHNNAVQLRLFCDDFDIDGIFIKNFKYVLGVNALPASTITGLSLFGGSVGGSGALTAGSPYEFKNFSSSGTGSSQQIDVNDANFITLINSSSGSDISVKGEVNDPRAWGLYQNYRRVQIITEDLLGSKIDGAIVYVRDTNNGSRRNWAAGTEGGTSFPAINFTDDRIYIETTNTQGETNEFDVLLSALARPTGSVSNAPNVGLNTQDIRGKYNNNTDLFDFHLWSYEHQYVGAEFALGGADNLIINQLFFTDTNITESNKTLVDAYSSIDNLNQLYDRAKSWKVNAANIAFPSIDQLLLTAEGTVVNTGNYDLILDGTAGGVFTVDNSPAQSITVQTTAMAASSQFSSLQSSGTISFVNGATLEAGYQDATGDYAYVELTNLDQQDLAITAMNAGVSSTLVNLSNFTGTYKGHIALPSLTASITVTARRDGYAPWTDMLPVGDLIFKREVNTSLASVTGVNQNVMVHLTTKLLQKTEALSHALYNTNNPVPTITVSLTTTSPTNIPSVTNQETILDLLYRILGKTTRLREAVQE